MRNTRRALVVKAFYSIYADFGETEKKMSSKTNPNKKSNIKKRKLHKRQYSLGKKLATTILLSLVAPLTVCFFGPFETYCGNIGEFTFALGDFLPYVAAISFIAAAIIFGVLMLLDGKAYDVAAAVILALTVLTFAQKYYLNLGVNALAGDGVGDRKSTRLNSSHD